ncbi:MAG: FliH/SctL family protein [Planctomycetota bacterium]|nr:FliH/SctL family protein [Planctomycetota bacterium]MEE2660900.1 FliH/SctL family protein [Planctomycetota bacterium]
MGLRKAASRAEPLLVDLSELGDSTRRVRQQAEAQAKAVRDRAAKDAQTLRDEAKTVGFDDGYAAGLLEGRAEGIRQAEAARAEELQDLVNQLQQAVGDVIAQTESCESAFARVVPEVVQDLVRKILPTAALTRPELVRDHALALAQQVPAPRSLRIYVSPDAHQRMHLDLPSLLQDLGPRERVELLADEALQPGDVRMEHGTGVIDGRISEAIDRLAEELLS